MAASITIDPRLNVKSVPASGGQRLVYMLLTLAPVPGAAVRQAPVNFAIAIDVSESMRLPVLSRQQFEELSRQGQVSRTASDGIDVWAFRKIPDHIRKQAPSNLEAIQASIADSARHLEEQDRLTLVAFAERAQVLLRGVGGSERGRLLEAVAGLGGAVLGDNTEIGAGLEAAVGEVRRARAQGFVDRVLLLTDGYSRDAARVVSFARQAGSEGIAISTLGIGSDFNEDLLVGIADASHGNAYFARTPGEIAPAFGEELEAIQSVSVRGLEARLTLSAGVELRRVYRARPAIAQIGDARRQGRSIAFPLGDLNPSDPPSVLAELVLPPQPPGVFRIARVAVAHDTPEGEKSVAGPIDVAIEYSAGAERPEMDPLVMNVVERVTAYALQTRALDEAAAGNIPGATQKLRAAATRLLEVGEPALARASEAEAARLEQQGQVSAEAAKEIRYATRKLTQRLVPDGGPADTRNDAGPPNV